MKDFFQHVFLIIATFWTLSTESAKILSIFQVSSPSHYIFASAILKELAARGHEVTSVNLYPQKEPIANFTDVFIDSNTNLLDRIVADTRSGIEVTGYTFFLKLIFMAEQLSINLLEHPAFQEILKSPENKFDLIIVEAIFTDSLHGLKEYFNVPIIGVSSQGTMLGIDDTVGNSSPASITPFNSKSYTSNMTHFQRVQNFLKFIPIYYLLYFKNYYMQQNIYEKYFPNAQLSFSDARKDFSLLILNQHHTLSYPRPYVPNVIEAGGAHIPHKPAPLPEDVQQFLDSATDGAIYFSLGSNVKSNLLPPEKREIFLNVFRGLKQKVLWKFEDAELPGKPDNVFISPWLPQHSVLAHPNVKVFMTHGGLLSVTEAIFFGKTFLGIPIFADQYKNVALTTTRKIALKLDLKSLNEQELKYKLSELLYNPIYTENMKEVSIQYHDKPMTAMETAIYWIEYVLRHKGAMHLRNAGADLNILQYYSVDVVGVILLGSMSIILMIIWFAKQILSKNHRPKSGHTKKVKRN